jgi:hypothetical protein
MPKTPPLMQARRAAKEKIKYIAVILRGRGRGSAAVPVARAKPNSSNVAA